MRNELKCLKKERVWERMTLKLNIGTENKQFSTPNNFESLKIFEVYVKFFVFF